MPGGLVLLFMRGARPDSAAIHTLCQNAGGFSVTHDPGEGANDHDPANWLELLCNGLTFDLLGLAGGPPAEPPALRHTFGLDRAMLDRVEAVTLVAGPHLSGGERMRPVVRSQLALGVRLTALPGLAAVVWTPAQSAMAVTYFVAVTSSWLEGGPFPALGLTAMTTALDGGLQSEGLAFFTGQELRLEPELAEDRVAATKLAVRLANELVEFGEVGERLEMTGLGGEPLVLEPSANRAFVRVRNAR